MFWWRGAVCDNLKRWMSLLAAINAPKIIDWQTIRYWDYPFHSDWWVSWNWKPSRGCLVIVRGLSCIIDGDILPIHFSQFILLEVVDSSIENARSLISGDASFDLHFFAIFLDWKSSIQKAHFLISFAKLTLGLIIRLRSLLMELFCSPHNPLQNHGVWDKGPSPKSYWLLRGLKPCRQLVLPNRILTSCSESRWN